MSALQSKRCRRRGRLPGHHGPQLHRVAGITRSSRGSAAGSCRLSTISRHSTSRAITPPWHHTHKMARAYRLPLLTFEAGFTCSLPIDASSCFSVSRAVISARHAACSAPYGHQSRPPPLVHACRTSARAREAAARAPPSEQYLARRETAAAAHGAPTDTPTPVCLMQQLGRKNGPMRLLLSWDAWMWFRHRSSVTGGSCSRRGAAVQGDHNNIVYAGFRLQKLRASEAGRAPPHHS